MTRTSPVDRDEPSRTPSSASGSSASAGWARCTPVPAAGCSQHYPDAPLRPRLVAVADTDDGAPEQAAHGVRVRRTPYADWRELIDARRRRRGQRLRAQLRAPRHGCRGGRGGQAHLGREAGRPQHLRDTAEIAAAVAGGGRAVGGRLQLPQRPGGRAGPRARRVGSARHGRDRRRPSARATTPPTPTARCRGGSTRSSPAPACSATWPATASTWRRTSRARRADDHRAGRRPGDVHHRASRADRRGLALLDARRATSLGPGRQRGPGRRRCCASRRVRAATLESSRVAVGEQCTLRHRGPRRPGRAGVGLPPDGELQVCARPGLPGRRLADASRHARATATWLPSSPAPGIAMGYDDLKVIEAERLVAIDRTRQAASAPRSTTPCVTAELVDAMVRVVRASRRWVSL